MQAFCEQIGKIAPEGRREEKWLFTEEGKRVIMTS